MTSGPPGALVPSGHMDGQIEQVQIVFTHLSVFNIISSVLGRRESKWIIMHYVSKLGVPWNNLVLKKVLDEKIMWFLKSFFCISPLSLSFLPTPLRGVKLIDSCPTQPNPTKLQSITKPNHTHLLSPLSLFPFYLFIHSWLASSLDRCPTQPNPRDLTSSPPSASPVVCSSAVQMEAPPRPATCSVCGPLGSRPGSSPGVVGLHYGAVTCYPCRQFFKRVGDRRERPPACGRGGACATDASLQPEVWAGQGRHCPGCRLEKCLRVGMELACVLTGQQRALRFAKSIGKRKGRGEDAEHTVEDQEPEASSSQGSSSGYRLPDRVPSPTTPAQSSPKQLRTGPSYCDQPLPQTEAKVNPCQRVSVIKNCSVQTQSLKNTLQTNPLTTETVRAKQCEFTESNHQMVKKYWYNRHLISSRPSVVVTCAKLSDLGVGDFHDVSTNENENIAVMNSDSFVNELQALKLPYSQSIAELELAYLFDAFSIPFMEERKKDFLASWHSLNLGEKVIRDYIEFCRTKGAVPAGWLTSVSKIVRERYIKVAINIDIVEDVPKSSLLRVLGDRLHLISALPWIFNWNVTSAEAKSEFCNGRQDQVQWRERGLGVESVGAEALLAMLVPGSQGARGHLHLLLQMLMAHKSTIFTDLSVHMMMMLLVIFDREDPCEQVRRVHRVAGDMLQRHLRVVSGQPAADLHLVHTCLAMVPAINKQLARVFRRR